MESMAKTGADKKATGTTAAAPLAKAALVTEDRENKEAKGKRSSISRNATTDRTISAIQSSTELKKSLAGEFHLKSTATSK